MPDIKNTNKFTLGAPSSFVSPFSDRPPTSFYSSIVIPRSGNDGGCTPCAIKSLHRKELQEFIEQIGSYGRDTTILSPLPPTKISETLPDDPNLGLDPFSLLDHDNEIFNAEVDPVTGDTYITGTFTEINGVPRSRIAKIRVDGTLDPDFDPGAGFDSATICRIHLSLDRQSVYVCGTNWGFGPADPIDVYGEMKYRGGPTGLIHKLSAITADPVPGFTPITGVPQAHEYFETKDGFVFILGWNNLYKFNATTGLSSATIGGGTNLHFLLQHPSGDYFFILTRATPCNSLGAFNGFPSGVKKLNASGVVDNTWGGVGTGGSCHAGAISPDGTKIAFGCAEGPSWNCDTNFSWNSGGNFRHRQVGFVDVTTGNQVATWVSQGNTLNSSIPVPVWVDNDGVITIINRDASQLWNGVARKPGTIYRIKPDGNLDATFDCTDHDGTELYSVKYNNGNNRYIVVGNFTTFKGKARNGIVFLTKEGKVI